MSRKVSAVASIERLQNSRFGFSLAHIGRLLEAREVKASRSLLCRIVSGEREASEALRAELQILASELAR